MNKKVAVVVTTALKITCAATISRRVSDYCARLYTDYLNARLRNPPNPKLPKLEEVLIPNDIAAIACAVTLYLLRDAPTN